MAQVPTVWQAQKNGKQWEAVNRVTGEVIPLAPLAGGRRWKEPHVWLFQETIRRLAEDHGFGQQSTRVLLYLLGVLDWDNWLVVPHTAISTALGMQPPNVSRAMAELLRRQVIEQAGAPAPRTAYRLMSRYAYKGSMAGLRARRAQEQRRRATGAVPQAPPGAGTCAQCDEPLFSFRDGRRGCLTCNTWVEEER